jgi:hypothetical protein
MNKDIAQHWPCQFCEVVASTQSNAMTHLVLQHAAHGDIERELGRRLVRARRKLAQVRGRGEADVERELGRV